jgi:hypothetical protein
VQELGTYFGRDWLLASALTAYVDRVVFQAAR